MNTNNSVYLNRAIENGHMELKNIKGKYPKHDDYYVKVKDDKGKDYEIIYFFRNEKMVP